MATISKQEAGMDSAGAIAISIALGAAAVIGKAAVGAAAKDAYDKVKSLILRRYPSVSVQNLEMEPVSGGTRIALEQDLRASNADKDTDLAIAASVLMALLDQEGLLGSQVVAVDLEEISAAALHLSSISSLGNAVLIRRAAIDGAIEIRDVRAGGRPPPSDND